MYVKILLSGALRRNDRDQINEYNVIKKKFARLSCFLMLFCMPPSTLFAQENTDNLASLVLTNTTSSRQYEFHGRIQATQSTTVASQVAGAVTELYVSSGDRVNKGQILVEVDPRTAAEGASATLAEVEAAKADLAVSRKELNRQQQLFNKKYISSSELDRTRARFEATAAQVRALEAKAKLAGTHTAFYTLAAPYRAIVSSVFTEVGDLAMPNKPLVAIYNPQALRLSAFVPVEFQDRIKDSAHATVVIGNNITLAVTALQILPVADWATNTVEVRVPIDGKSITNYHITPGTFARLRVDIAMPDAKETLMIPKSAVFARAQLRFVYVKNRAGLPVLRMIREGAEYEAQMEVVSGLEIGDEIYLEPDAVARQQAYPSEKGDDDAPH